MSEERLNRIALKRASGLGILDVINLRESLFPSQVGLSADATPKLVEHPFRDLSRD